MANEMKHTPDVLTPDQQRWLGGHLWSGLTAFPDRPGIPFWDTPVAKRKQSTSVAVKCGRCNGEGAIASFSIRYSGICFACGGSGFRLISQAAYKRRAAIAKATGA